MGSLSLPVAELARQQICPRAEERMCQRKSAGKLEIRKRPLRNQTDDCGQFPRLDSFCGSLDLK